MTILSSDPLNAFIAGFACFLALLTLMFVVLDWRKPIIRAFHLSVLSAFIAGVSYLEKVWTSHPIWTVGTALFTVLTAYFAAICVLRWWKKWGPA